MHGLVAYKINKNIRQGKKQLNFCWSVGNTANPTMCRLSSYTNTVELYGLFRELVWLVVSVFINNLSDSFS